MEKQTEEKKSSSKELEFLVKDTNNLTEFEKTLSGRLFLLNEKVNKEDKNLISSLESEIELSRQTLERELKEIDGMEPSGPFAKLTFVSKKKKLVSAAEKKYEDANIILENRLKNAKKIFEQDRKRLQEMINNLENGEHISWLELKRIISEKIAQGFFIHKQLTESEVQEPTKSDKLTFKKADKRARQRWETIAGEGGRTFKEKNVSGLSDIYKIKGLTEEQMKEYEEILKHMLYDAKNCKDPLSARKLRLALAMAKGGKFRNLVLFTSDKAIYRNVFMYFAKEDGVNYKRDFDRIFTSKASSAIKSKFFKDKAAAMMLDSGFSDDFIASHTGVYAKELERLLSYPKEMIFVLNRMQNIDLNSEVGKRYFEDEVRREVNNRLEIKHRLYGLDCFDSSSTFEKRY